MYSDLAETIKHRVKIVSQLPDRIHYTLPDMDENERRPSAIRFFSASWFCNNPQKWSKITLIVSSQKNGLPTLTFKSNISLSLCWIISTDSSNCLQSLQILINNSGSCMNAAGCCFLSWFIQPGKKKGVHVTGGEKEVHLCFAGPYHRQLNTWLFGVEHTSRFY